MSRPAIGKDSVYFIHDQCCKPSRDSGRVLFFGKHRLCDGSKVFDVAMPPETEGYGKIPELDRSPVLSWNQRLASWRRHAPGLCTSFPPHLGGFLKSWIAVVAETHAFSKALFPAFILKASRPRPLAT